MLIDIVFLHHCVSIGQCVCVCGWCQCDVTIIIKLSCASVIQLILKFSVGFGPEYFPLANKQTCTHSAYSTICFCLSSVRFSQCFLNVCRFFFFFAFYVCVGFRHCRCPYPSTWLSVCREISFDLKLTGIIQLDGSGTTGLDAYIKMLVIHLYHLWVTAQYPAHIQGWLKEINHPVGVVVTCQKQRACVCVCVCWIESKEMIMAQ